MNNNNLVSGFIYLAKGFGDLLRPGIKKFVIIPLIISIIIFGALFYFGFDYAWEKIALLSVTHLVPSWLQWLNAVLSFFKIILMIMTTLFMLIAVGIISTIVANIIASPFNGILSEKLSQQLNHHVPASPSIFTMVLREIRKLLYYLPRALLVGIIALILYFIPVANLLSPILLFGFGAWMMAIQYIDYPADNFHTTFSKLMVFLKNNRQLSMGFGLGVMFFSTIPLINFILMPAAVLGATRLWHDTQM